ncbi:MAG TPA: hypothetical protein VM846_02525 [Vicinamibacterales bacterium]|nr:hypothetical protein [Vicinamibacterales bacterium]
MSSGLPADRNPARLPRNTDTSLLAMLGPTLVDSWFDLNVQRIIAGVRALPGVRGVAFGSMLPFQSPGNTRVFSVEGRQLRPGDLPDALFRIGTADYLQTLGVTLVESASSMRAMAPMRLAPLSSTKTLVRRFMDGQSALGRQIRFGPTEPPFTVVGVVRDVLERGYEQDSNVGTIKGTR